MSEKLLREEVLLGNVVEFIESYFGEDFSRGDNKMFLRMRNEERYLQQFERGTIVEGKKILCFAVGRTFPPYNTTNIFHFPRPF